MNTLSNTHHAPARKQRIAVVTMGVKLGDETRGYTRFRFLSELLVREGFDVTLFTSSFQHWEKAQRDVERACYRDLPYRVVFIPEPGYKKNLDLARIMSHRKAAKNLRRMLSERFAADARAFDVARVCAETAHEHDISFVAVNDVARGHAHGRERAGRAISPSDRSRATRIASTSCSRVRWEPPTSTPRAPPLIVRSLMSV